MPFGFDFGSSSSSSSSSSQGSTFVDPSQAPFLDFLRNQGLGSFGGFQQGAQALGQSAQGLFGQGQDILGGLQNNQFLQSLGQQAGGNPQLVAQQTQQLGSDLGQFFNEQLLPGISRNAQGVGQLGGGRQGVAQGQAAQGVSDAFSQGVTGFQTADAQRSLQAAQVGGQLFNQGALGGLDSLSSLFGMQQGAFQSQFSPLFALQQLFGGPNNLSQQSSESQSKFSSFNAGVANIA